MDLASFDWCSNLIDIFQEGGGVGGGAGGGGKGEGVRRRERRNVVIDIDD